MAYNQKEMSLMGRIVANQEKKKKETVFKKYETHLYRALSKPPKYTSNINVLMHAMGYFSKELSKEEKKFILFATSLKGMKISNILPSKMKKGVPGGCGTPRICEQAMNSPQSQSETVGAIVYRYAEIRTINTDENPVIFLLSYIYSLPFRDQYNGLL